MPEISQTHIDELHAEIERYRKHSERSGVDSFDHGAYHGLRLAAATLGIKVDK